MYNKCMILEHRNGVKKIAKIYEYYKLNLDFPVDRRYSYSPSKWLKLQKFLYRYYYIQ